MTWVVRLPCTRAEAEAALRSDLPEGWALTAFEGAEGWWIEVLAPTAPSAWPRALPAGLQARWACAQAERLPPEDWLARSAQGLSPLRAGRFRILPGPAARQPPSPHRWTLRLPHTRAFGTGHHATTRGCLQLMEWWARRRRLRRVLDLGTGSGILALAARRLAPAARVLASDLDAQALAVARAHARANGVASLRFARGPGVAPPAILRAAPFDLVLANILAGPLVHLATALAGLVRPGGAVILAGLLAGAQERQVAARYRQAGFRRGARRAGEWPVLLLIRRGRGPGPAAGRPLRAARRGRGAALRTATSI
ncbi:MAG: 50S ribosomal protein L11 methyltransferase [Thermaurantiacus sp.]|uniref:50S ribosomal protein L11 methyltransferase n=1 Tax=Thermaurantiacus sp. TaxID=2820283 RepID=UPI00298F3192|nr:50S ribosomal protein L11 methyltransferase [Thermaurantiacus sp.]MDW8414030.1 50S ribosomal protein L11 methyltransferase [Thermaurantiacus sp.]